MHIGEDNSNIGGAPFRVYDDGYFVASKANITGSITATSGTFTGTVSGSKISGSEISGGTIKGGTIKGGTISGASISGGSISGTTISASGLVECGGINIGGDKYVAASQQVVTHVSRAPALSFYAYKNSTTKEREKYSIIGFSKVANDASPVTYHDILFLGRIK